MYKRLLAQPHELVVFVGRQFAISLPSVELVQSLAVGMNGRQGAEHVERDIDRFTVAEMLLAVRVVGEKFAFDVLHDEVPLAALGAVGPDNLHHVRVVDFPQRADLASDGVVAGGVVEELEGSLFSFDYVSDSIHP